MTANPMLGKDIEIREVGAPLSASSSIDDNSDRIDMAGYEGVIFVGAMTDSVNGGVATFTVEQNSADSDTGMSALAGAVATKTSAADDDLNGKTLKVEVYRPRERYVQLVRKSATQNIAYSSLFAILYGSKKLPITEHSSNSAAAAVTSPAES